MGEDVGKRTRHTWNHGRDRATALAGDPSVSLPQRSPGYLSFMGLVAPDQRCTSARWVMSNVLHAKLLKKIPEHECVVWFELLAAICPPAQRHELRQQLADFDQSVTVTPVALLDILDGMENDGIHG